MYRRDSDWRYWRDSDWRQKGFRLEVQEGFRLEVGGIQTGGRRDSDWRYRRDSDWRQDGFKQQVGGIQTYAMLCYEGFRRQVGGIFNIGRNCNKIKLKMQKILIKIKVTLEKKLQEVKNMTIVTGISTAPHSQGAVGRRKAKRFPDKFQLCNQT